MSFDFFNTSHLAFGTKLYTAFLTLENLAKEAEKNLDQVFQDQKIFDLYMNKNYQVPRPTKPTSPCRVNEVYDFLNDKAVYITKLTYKEEMLKVGINLYNRNNDRITRLTGETTIKEGYCFYKSEAVSNENVDRPLYFAKDLSEVQGMILFQYRIDNNNIINLIGSTAELGLIPNDINNYTGISLGDTVAGINKTYKSHDYECILVVGRTNNIDVHKNGKRILRGQGNLCMRCCIVYLKPEDVISGTYEYIQRINYLY